MDALIQLVFCQLLAVSTSITAVVYVNILTQPGMLLDWWAEYLHNRKDRYVKSAKEFAQHEYDYFGVDVDPMAEQAKAEERAEYWLKPILTCVYCVSGQLSFWACLYLSWWYFNAFNVNLSLLCAGVGVFLAGLFQYVQQKYFPQ